MSVRLGGLVGCGVGALLAVWACMGCWMIDACATAWCATAMRLSLYAPSTMNTYPMHLAPSVCLTRVCSLSSASSLQLVLEDLREEGTATAQEKRWAALLGCEIVLLCLAAGVVAACMHCWC
jgi:hypothetical protein